MDRPSEIRVVSAVADKKQAVLYLDNGEQLIIKQGDHRLGDLLNIIIPITARGETAVVFLADFSVYVAFEKKTTGLTRFFKVAKDKVKGFFGGHTDTHKATLSEDGKQAILKAVMGETMTMEEVAEHGTPVDVTDEITTDEVVVAVVTTPAVPATETAPAQPERKTVIPGVQNLKPLIDNSVKTNSTQSVQNFLTRCAAFIDKRQHSVDDLMRFLEKGDLPLAEDGSIIAYKMLKYYGGNREVFVDCHTQKIQQKVGSYVCVNEDLVDLNRRTECSNGLHIARRGYLSGFGGDLCVVCKIDPEDVMVVPHNDANKVRVKGYHILGVLSPEAMSALKQGKAATNDEAALKLIYDAIKGHHVDRLERVQVNGQAGTKVEITKLRGAETRIAPVDVSGQDLSQAKALDDENAPAGAVDVREINKRVTEAMSGTKAYLIIKDEIDDNPEGVEDEEDDDNEVEGSGDDEADESTSPTHGDYQGEHPDEPEPAKTASAVDDLLLDFNTAPEGNAKVDAARALIAFKKAKKKGWDKLGIDGKTVDAIMAAAQQTAEPASAKAKAPEPAPVAKPKAGTKEKRAKAAPQPKPAKVKPEPVAKATPPAKSTTAKPLTKAEEARKLFDAGKLDDLRAFKKRVKKGWEILGFNSSEIKKIENK